MTHWIRTFINLLMMLVVSIAPVMNCHASIMVQSAESAVNMVDSSRGHEASFNQNSGQVKLDSCSSGMSEHQHGTECPTCSHCCMMCSPFYSQNVSLVIHSLLSNVIATCNSTYIPVDIRPPIQAV